MWRMFVERAGIALVCLGMCGPPSLAQPKSKEPPKLPAPPPVVEVQPGQPAFQLSDEQKQGLAEKVAQAPWLLVIGGALLLAVVISAIVMRPEVLWGRRKKKGSRSLYRGERREPGRNVITLDPNDLGDS